MIRAVPVFARKAFGSDVVIARMGGDESAVLTYGKPVDIAAKIAKMKEYSTQHSGSMIDNVYLSAGFACQSEYKGLPPEGLFQTADKFMYEDKTNYYNQNGHDRRRR